MIESLPFTLIRAFREIRVSLSSAFNALGVSA